MNSRGSNTSNLRGTPSITVLLTGAEERPAARVGGALHYPAIVAAPVIPHHIEPRKTYLVCMAIYHYTEYFEKEVLRKRSYLRKQWCEAVLQAPIRCEPQEKNRYRFWGKVPELGNRYPWGVTLEDKATIHNAFPDRGFTE